MISIFSSFALFLIQNFKELAESGAMEIKVPTFSKALTQAEELLFLSNPSPIKTSNLFGSGFFE